MQEAKDGGGSTALPTPDATGSIAMSATAGKVARTSSQSALTCASACHAASGVVDFVGYGATANDVEGSGAAPTPSASISDQRKGGGATDTDDNTADFGTAAPTPQNSAGTGSGGGGGGPVSGVTVAGTVSEVRPGGTRDSDALSVTEITGPTVTPVSSGNSLPAPVVVGAAGRVPPSENYDSRNDTTGNLETSGDFDPTYSGVDFWESLEGMRVELDNAAVVGPTNGFGEISVVGDKGARATGRTTRGGVSVTAADFNPERVMLSPTLASLPACDVGDVFTGPRPQRPPQPPAPSSRWPPSTWGTSARATRSPSSTGSPGSWCTTSAPPTWSRSRRSRTTTDRPTTGWSRPTRPTTS